ncbi:uncharacterized protein LOC124930209 [Impatiens glandulifera]|uniref:uncharacterized protein LOC124930209 n=1 Tax=Impatiens glandulifera TaxID=253017 RepID=UPI001FB0529B|nr:uncharacterized protein LOC124930209 [Impatiens glandulifera]
MKNVFSDTSFLVETHEMKSSLKHEFSILNDIISKSLLSKASTNVYSKKIFKMMVAITRGIAINWSKILFDNLVKMISSVCCSAQHNDRLSMRRARENRRISLKGHYDIDLPNDVKKVERIGLQLRGKIRELDRSSEQAVLESGSPKKARGLARVNAYTTRRGKTDFVPLSSKTDSMPLSDKTNYVPLNCKTDFVHLSGKTDYVPLSGKTNYVSLRGKTDYVPLSGKTDFVPLSGKTDFVHLSGKTDYVPFCGKTDYVPLSGKTDYVPLSGKTDYVPLRGKTDFVPLSGKTDYEHLTGKTDYVPLSGKTNYVPLSGKKILWL